MLGIDMSWGQEILRAFLLALGSFEIIANLTHLFRKDGLKTARKQHGELPRNVSEDKLKLKVICMLTAGIAFFAVSLSSYILHRYTATTILMAAVLFCAYGITEALYYRHWKTSGFAIVTLLILISAILNRLL